MTPGKKKRGFLARQEELKSYSSKERGVIDTYDDNVPRVADNSTNEKELIKFKNLVSAFEFIIEYFYDKTTHLTEGNKSSLLVNMVTLMREFLRDNYDADTLDFEKKDPDGRTNEYTVWGEILVAGADDGIFAFLARPKKVSVRGLKGVVTHKRKVLKKHHGAEVLQIPELDEGGMYKRLKSADSNRRNRKEGDIVIFVTEYEFGGQEFKTIIKAKRRKERA